MRISGNAGAPNLYLSSANWAVRVSRSINLGNSRTRDYSGGTVPLVAVPYNYCYLSPNTNCIVPRSILVNVSLLRSLLNHTGYVLHCLWRTNLLECLSIHLRLVEKGIRYCCNCLVNYKPKIFITERSNYSGNHKYRHKFSKTIDSCTVIIIKLLDNDKDVNCDSSVFDSEGQM